MLTERHGDLVHERTRVLNRLHAVLRDLLPGGVPAGLSASKAAAAMKTIRPATATGCCRRAIARDLLADLRRLDRLVKDNQAQMRGALAVAGTTLTRLPGLSTVLAATIIGHVSDVTRFPTEHHFASYTGSAPLDASSGNHTRHRLNAGGNRALNCVLHIIATCQIRDPGRGQDYYQRKITEGKTPPRHAAPSNDACPTSSTAPCNATAATTSPPPLDTQRRYQATDVPAGGRSRPPAGSWPAIPDEGTRQDAARYLKSHTRSRRQEATRLTKQSPDHQATRPEHPYR